MKKIISLTLAIMMILSLCACGSDSTNADNGSPEAGGNSLADGKFKVGYHAANITPDELGVPMNGYGNAKERLSTGLMSYIYAISIAVVDGDGNAAVLTSVDMAAVGPETIEEVRVWVSNTYGIPKANLVISAIHQPCQCK